MVRELMGEGEFIEVYVDTALDECIRRDPKGLYAAREPATSRTSPGSIRPMSHPKRPKS